MNSALRSLGICACFLLGASTFLNAQRDASGREIPEEKRVEIVSNLISSGSAITCWTCDFASLSNNCGGCNLSVSADSVFFPHFNSEILYETINCGGCYYDTVLQGWFPKTESCTSIISPCNISICVITEANEPEKKEDFFGGLCGHGIINLGGHDGCIGSFNGTYWTWALCIPLPEEKIQFSMLEDTQEVKAKKNYENIRPKAEFVFSSTEIVIQIAKAHHKRESLKNSASKKSKEKNNFPEKEIALILPSGSTRNRSNNS
ncbi:MAG: hypothetical protein IAF38_09230 [Bacteroidia bacterium]|nr:hypothetical protein [Bacteroidia bacterium]